jgi:hypothetical protein
MHVILDVAPLLGIAVLQPKNARRDIRRIMLAHRIRNNFPVLQNFFLDDVDFISDRTLRQCALNVGIEYVLGLRNRLTELLVAQVPYFYSTVWKQLLPPNFKKARLKPAPAAMGRFLLTQMASVAELEAGLISVGRINHSSASETTSYLGSALTSIFASIA